MLQLSNTVSPATDVQVIQQRPSPARLLALDVVRGFVMVLMLISHSAWWLDDFDYGVAYGWDNMIVPNVSLPDSIPGLVLQLATPAFFLLGGVSIALFSASRQWQGWRESRITKFLFTRGLVLIGLDLVVMNLRLNSPYYSNHISVLTGIGICVCLMAWLRRLDWRILTGLALLVLLGTQVYYHTLTIAGEWPREASLLRAILIAPSVEDLTWKSQFPALGWLPVVLLGFITGTQVAKGVSLTKLTLVLGLGCLALFALLRFSGDIGSLYPTNPLIFGKHPPDLEYLSFYVGLTYVLIALLSILTDVYASVLLKVFVILGQSALFFYVVHIRLIELVSPLFAPLPLPPLVRSFLIVMFVLPTMVILSQHYRSHKRKHPESVLRYL